MRWFMWSAPTLLRAFVCLPALDVEASMNGYPLYHLQLASRAVAPSNWLVTAQVLVAYCHLCLGAVCFALS